MNKREDRHKILIVDDKERNVREIEQWLFAEGYSVIRANSGRQALNLVDKEKPDLVIVDVLLPDIDGQTVCRRIKEEESTALLPVIMITTLATTEDRLQSIEAGCDDFLTKPVNEHEMVARVNALLKTKAQTDKLISAERIVQSLAIAIEEKDPYTCGHSLRVGEYSAQLARSIGLDDADQELLKKAAMLHDIGMIGVELSILHKPGPLTKEEFEIVREHPLKGIEIKGVEQTRGRHKPPMGSRSGRGVHRPTERLPQGPDDRALDDEPLASLADRCWLPERGERGII